MNTVKELKYSVSNNYLIKGIAGNILFDTGWAGTFPQLCRALGEAGEQLGDIRYLLVSHFHPDHAGLAGELAAHDVKTVILDVQKNFTHAADAVFRKENNAAFVPINDDDLLIISAENSRAFLKSLGIDGELLHTPGHSDDSISLVLDGGYIFVGDLNPLYEIEAHKGTQIEASWQALLARKPKTVCYGHAKTAFLSEPLEKSAKETAASFDNTDLYSLITRVMDCVDRNYPLRKIMRKTGADQALAEQIIRMYMTHPNVGAEGILDRLENSRRR